MTNTDFVTASIEINGRAYVYIQNPEKDVIDRKTFPDRARAVRWIHDAYPDSDIHTVARFLG